MKKNNEIDTEIIIAKLKARTCLIEKLKDMITRIRDDIDYEKEFLEEVEENSYRYKSAQENIIIFNIMIEIIENIIKEIAGNENI